MTCPSKKTFLLFTLFLIALCAFVLPQQLQAQISSTLINSGSGTKGGPNVEWKTEAEGILIAEQQIDDLEAALSALQQQGADAKLIGKVSTELLYYQLVLQGLQAGKPLWHAIQDAYATIGGGTDNAADHPYMTIAELEAMYNASIAKFSK